MSKKEKLLERFYTLPKDFTYEEFRQILSYFDFEEHTKRKTSGSRVRFVNTKTKAIINLHKLHPGNIVKFYVLKAVQTKLIEISSINNNL